MLAVVTLCTIATVSAQGSKREYVNYVDTRQGTDSHF